MFQQYLRVTILVVGTFFTATAFGQEPTVDQVYREAQSGNLAEAQAMMAQVLRAHPNSAKAHFVNAELLARQGRLADADVELRAAERLEPGLPFTTPQAVQELHRRVASGQGTASRTSPSSVAPYGGPIPARSTGGGIPWLTVLLVAGVALVVYFVFRSLRRGSATSVPVGSTGYNAAQPMQGPNAARPMQGPGYAPQAPMGGMGSGILGGLATGAAVGAGVVAGEALAHRFSDRHNDTGSSAGVADATPSADSLGGNDFGIADASSWDDNLGGGGGSGSDWS